MTKEEKDIIDAKREGYFDALSDLNCLFSSTAKEIYITKMKEKYPYPKEFKIILVAGFKYRVNKGVVEVYNISLSRWEPSSPYYNLPENKDNLKKLIDLIENPYELEPSCHQNRP